MDYTTLVSIILPIQLITALIIAYFIMKSVYDFLKVEFGPSKNREVIGFSTQFLKDNFKIYTVIISMIIPIIGQIIAWKLYKKRIVLQLH